MSWVKQMQKDTTANLIAARKRLEAKSVRSSQPIHSAIIKELEKRRGEQAAWEDITTEPRTPEAQQTFEQLLRRVFTKEE